MAATLGRNGSLRNGAVQVDFIDTWSLDESIDTVEVTAYGSSFKDNESTLKSWSCSFGGTLDRSSTDQVALLDQFEDGTLADIALRFYTSSIAYWGGNVKLTGNSITSAVGDKVAISFSGIGNGALSYVTGT
jgi:hypothetical protein